MVHQKHFNLIAFKPVHRESVTIYDKLHRKTSKRSLNCCFCKAVGKTTRAGLAKASSRRKNILSRELKFRNCMLFPEKMIDFVRTTGPLFICGESLASGKFLAKMTKKTKQKKKKKHQNKVWTPNFQSSSDYSKTIDDRIFISRNTFWISEICDRHFGSQQKVGCLTQWNKTIKITNLERFLFFRVKLNHFSFKKYQYLFILSKSS